MKYLFISLAVGILLTFINEFVNSKLKKKGKDDE